MNRRINNEQFSVRLCLIAKNYGFITVGQLYRFLKNCLPHARIGVTYGSYSAQSLIDELEREFRVLGIPFK